MKAREKRLVRAPGTSSGADEAARRRRAHGQQAEAAAVARLEANGFAILHRNLRLGSLELDIVAQKGDLVVVVEVRTRGGRAYESALGSVSIAKRRLLIRGVRELWRRILVARGDVHRVRIDVAAVRLSADGQADIEWIAGALTADEP